MVEEARVLQNPEHEMMSRFIGGLPEKMAFFVRGEQPRDIQSGLISAKTAETSCYRQSTDSVNAVQVKQAGVHFHR